MEQVQQQEQERDTCVYLHHKQSDGVCFYVGIGVPKRPYDTNGRSKPWNHTVAKHGRTVKVIATDLTWDAACFLEVSAIALLGRRNLKQGALVNLTNGGEGAKGVIVSEETRAKLVKHWSNPTARASMKAAVKASLNTPEALAANSERGKLYFSNPENREAARARLSRFYSNPVNLAAHRKAHNRPETKTKMSALHTKSANQVKLGCGMYADRPPKAGTKSAEMWALLERVTRDTGKMPMKMEFGRIAEQHSFVAGSALVVHQHYRAHQLWLTNPELFTNEQLAPSKEAKRESLSAVQNRPEVRAAKAKLWSDPAYVAKMSAANTIPAEHLKLEPQMAAHKLPKAGTKHAQVWDLLDSIVKKTGALPMANDFGRFAASQGFPAGGSRKVFSHYRAHQAYLAAQAANNAEALEVA